MLISPAGRRDSVPTASAMRTRSWSSWPLVNVWSVLGTSMTFSTGAEGCLPDQLLRREVEGDYCCRVRRSAGPVEPCCQLSLDCVPRPTTEAISWARLVSPGTTCPLGRSF